MKKKITAIVVFMAFLILPNIIFPLISGYIDTENHENRAYAEFPSFSLREPGKFFDGLTTYYNDHVPFKNQLKRLNTFTEDQFSKTESAYTLYKNTALAIKGQDDWLFYTPDYEGEDTVDDYVGVRRYTEEQLAELAHRYQQANDWFKANGVEFVLFIAPGKEQIYDEYMPAVYPARAQISRAEQLVQYLQTHTDVKAIYPRKEFDEYKKNYQIYYKYDTHWNRLGAFIGLQTVMQALNGHSIKAEDAGIEEIPAASHDLANILGIKYEPEKDTAYDLTNYFPDITYERVGSKKQKDVRYFKSNAADHRKVLFCIDSFGTTWDVQAEKEFSDIVFVQGFEHLKETFEKEKPDIVVMEIAERFSARTECWTIDLVSDEASSPILD